MMYKALRCADDLMLLFVVAFQFHSIRCNCATSYRTLVPRNRKQEGSYYLGYYIRVPYCRKLPYRALRGWNRLPLRVVKDLGFFRGRFTGFRVLRVRGFRVGSSGLTLRHLVKRRPPRRILPRQNGV